MNIIRRIFKSAIVALLLTAPLHSHRRTRAS